MVETTPLLCNTIKGSAKVIVHGCFNLPNKETGIMGDVDDPYVKVSIGSQERLTPVADNTLNPQYSKDNDFDFELSEDSQYTVKLQVFNKNVLRRDDDLGSTVIDLRSLVPNQSHELRQKLDGNSSGEVAF